MNQQVKLLLGGLVVAALLSMVIVWGCKIYSENENARIQKETIQELNQNVLRENVRRNEKKLRELEWQMQLNDTPTKSVPPAGSAEEAYEQGWEQFNKGKYDQAIGYFSKAIELDPKMASAYDNRGNAYFYLANYAYAITDYNKAIEIRPDYAPTYSFRMEAYLNLGKFDEAWADVHKGKELGFTPTAQFMDKLIKYSGKDETNWINPKTVLKEAEYHADMDEYKAHAEWSACKQDMDCAIGGIGCQNVPVNKDFLKAPIRTPQEMFFDRFCSDVRNSGKRTSVSCVNNKCEIH